MHFLLPRMSVTKGIVPHEKLNFFIENDSRTKCLKISLDVLIISNAIMFLFVLQNFQSYPVTDRNDQK